MATRVIDVVLSVILLVLGTVVFVVAIPFVWAAEGLLWVGSSAMMASISAKIRYPE